MKKKKPKNNRIIKLLIILVIILFIVLLIVIFFDYNLKDHFKKFFSKETKYIEIKDECSLILGNIIHQIRDENECTIHCNNNCKLESMFYKSSNFITKNNSCHTCNCYCK